MECASIENAGVSTPHEAQHQLHGLLLATITGLVLHALLVRIGARILASVLLACVACVASAAAWSELGRNAVIMWFVVVLLVVEVTRSTVQRLPPSPVATITSACMNPWTLKFSDTALEPQHGSW